MAKIIVLKGTKNDYDSASGFYVYKDIIEEAS